MWYMLYICVCVYTKIVLNIQTNFEPMLAYICLLCGHFEQEVIKL